MIAVLFSSHAITADVDLVETAQTAELFSSDGLILTGRSTGHATDSQQLQGQCGKFSSKHYYPVIYSLISNISRYVTDLSKMVYKILIKS